MNATNTDITEAPEAPVSHVPDMKNKACPAIRDVLNRVGDKWSVLVIGNLGGGSKRFSELQRNIDGISQRMLTLTLRQLERDGLVIRTVFPVVPPRVDYELTKLGQTLLDTVKELANWAGDHGQAIQAAREEYDQRDEITA